MELTLIFPCFGSDPTLSRQGDGIARIDSFRPKDLVSWTDGSVPFSFGKNGSRILSNCSLYSAEATLFLLAGPVCSCLSLEPCAILQTLRWFRQHRQVTYFSSLLLLSDPRFFLTLLFSHPSFLYFKLSGTSGWNCVFSFYFTIRQRRIWLIGRAGCATAVPCSFSLLTSRINFLFSRTGGVPSYLNYWTHRFFWYPLRNL